VGWGGGVVKLKVRWELLAEWKPPRLYRRFRCALYRLIGEESKVSWSRRVWNSITKPGFHARMAPDLPLDRHARAGAGVNAAYPVRTGFESVYDQGFHPPHPPSPPPPPHPPAGR